MKRAIIGGFISLIGSIWSLAFVLIGANNMVSGWSTPPGRFITTMNELDLMPLFVISLLFVALGIVLMTLEYFKPRNDKLLMCIS